MPSWIQEKQTKKQSERSKPAKKQQREQERKSQLQKTAMVSGCREDIDEKYTWTKNQDQGLTTAANAHHSQSRPTVAKAKPPVPGITAFLHTSVNSNLARICTNTSWRKTLMNLIFPLVLDHEALQSPVRVGELCMTSMDQERKCQHQPTTSNQILHQKPTHPTLAC